MDLVKSLNVFFIQENIRGADIQNISYIIKREEGDNAILDEFWSNLLKKSCNDNVFSVKQFNNLLESTRFSEKDIKDFLDSEYTGINEEIVKSILNTKEQILGKQCKNIKFDLLILDALWGFDPNDSFFLENWAVICREVDKVEKETRPTNIIFYNQHEDFAIFNNPQEDIEDCAKQVLTLGVTENSYD